MALARDHGLDPAQMALAFCHRQPFVTSTIIGATSLAQLKTDLGGFEPTLSDEILTGIEAIHRALPNPCPWSPASVSTACTAATSRSPRFAAR